MSELSPTQGQHYVVNWAVASIVIAIMIAAAWVSSFSIYMHYTDKTNIALMKAENEQWQKLYDRMSQGCANPDNQLASIKMQFKPGQMWTCTPYGK